MSEILRFFECVYKNIHRYTLKV